MEEVSRERIAAMHWMAQSFGSAPGGVREDGYQIIGVNKRLTSQNS